MPDARSGLIAALLLTTSAVAAPTGNEMNPAISLILQAHYADYDRDPEGYELPGFQLGGEAGLAAEGFGLGHSELLVSANIDDRFRGNLTVALAEHEGATEVELEEAYIETLGLPVVRGVTVKAGRFFSNLGYLNNQHTHAWDFTDAPLVYRGLFGDQLIDDGIQVRWLAPGVLFVQIGVELGRGERFPAGGARKGGRGSQVAFAEFGGDVGVSHSWQMGISRWSAEIEGRESGGHSHGGATEVPAYTGDSSVTALDLVWKWAPNGNYRDRNLKLQFEYLRRHEHGSVAMLGSAPLEETGYDGKQRGWYLQAVYQFRRGWRIGLRQDRLESSNSGSNTAVLGEAGLLGDGHSATRSSIMIDHARSEFSRLRLQYNHDRSQRDADRQIYLQFVMSLGAHGAHQF